MFLHIYVRKTVLIERCDKSCSSNANHNRTNTINSLLHSQPDREARHVEPFGWIQISRGEANMLKILPIILFHSAHKLSLLFL